MQFLAEEEVWLSQPRCSKQTGRCKYAHKLNEIKIIRESQNSCFQYIYIFFAVHENSESSQGEFF